MADVYLLDTCMVARLADDRSEDEVEQATLRFRERVAALENPRLLICAITVGEVEDGLESAPAFPPEKRQKVRRTLAAFDPVLEISHDTAAPWYSTTRARLFDKYGSKKKRGQRRRVKRIESLTDTETARELGIDENDLWIASVALQYNLVLVTADKGIEEIRSVCPRLRLENWLDA